MKKLLTLAAVTAVAVSTVAVAREHGPRHGGFRGHGERGSAATMERHLEYMADELKLTTEQRESARKLHADSSARAEALHEQMRAAHDEVETLLESPNPDPTALGQKMLAAREARNQMKALHEELFGQFRALLDAEQQKKLDEMHSERSRMRERHERWDDGDDD
jgi:Spy/CpxP family protein refolding chaperone